MPGTAVLVGLWLRGLKQKKCLAIVSEWRSALLNRGAAANENIAEQHRSEKVAALAALDAACAACTKACRNNPAPQAVRTVKLVRRHTI
jgi:hypothetical protein